MFVKPLIRSQVTGVRYYNEAKGKFFEDVLGLLNLKTKILVTKCAISLKEAIYLIKQAHKDKVFFVPQHNTSFAVNFWRGIFVNMKHFMFILQYWLDGRGFDLYKLGLTWYN